MILKRAIEEKYSFLISKKIMTKVKVRKGESLEQALRRFNREVHKARILQEVKDRERYTKPSELRRQKKKELARKINYENRKRR